MNREKLSTRVAEELSKIHGSSGYSEMKVQSIANRILADAIINTFIDCEISVSTAIGVLDQVKQTIAVETVVNKEAKEKKFFS